MENRSKLPNALFRWRKNELKKLSLKTRWRVLKVLRYINIKDAKNFEYTVYLEDALQHKFSSLSVSYPRENYSRHFSSTSCDDNEINKLILFCDNVAVILETLHRSF